MKTTVKVLVLAFMLSTSMTFAKNFLPVEDFPKAMNQINEYLNQTVLEDKFETLNSVKVIFSVNSDSEIVILDIRTQNKEAKNYIKANLDRKQLTAGDLIPGKQYTFMVVFK